MGREARSKFPRARTWSIKNASAVDHQIVPAGQRVYVVAAWFRAGADGGNMTLRGDGSSADPTTTGAHDTMYLEGSIAAVAGIDDDPSGTLSTGGFMAGPFDGLEAAMSGANNDATVVYVEQGTELT